MSNIVIMDLEVDLQEWLTKHGVRILLQEVPVGGWKADFDKTTVVEGTRCPIAHKGADTTEEKQILAVRVLLRSLKGCKIGFSGPAHLWVPDFIGIEEAIKNAVRQSECP